MTPVRSLLTLARQTMLVVLIACGAGAAAMHQAAADQPAKQIFGAAKLPAVLPARAIGFYSKGCLAGGIAIPADGMARRAFSGLED